MKTRTKIILLSIMMGLVFWIIEGEIAHQLNWNVTLPDALLFELTAIEWFVRVWVVVSFLIFGVIVVNYISRQEDAEAKAEQAFQELKNVFESSPDGMCLIDNDYNVIRMNNRLGEHLGVSRDDIVGKRCREVFSSPRCATIECPLKRILSGEERIEIEVTKTLLNGDVRHFLLTATPCRSENGMLLGIVENLHDITEQKMAQEKLFHRLAMEQMLAEVSSQFINLPTEELDKGVTRAIKAIGEYSRVDRSYIFLFRDDCEMMDNTHEWCAFDIESQRDKLQYIPLNTLPWWMSILRRHENVHIPLVKNMPPEASAEREVLESQDIQSLIVVPMISGSKLIGFMGFDTVRTTKAWTEGDIRILRMAAETIVSALDRKKSDEAIRELSAHRAELDAIITSSSAVAFRWANDKRWTVTFVTDNIRQYGYTPDELIEDRVSYASLIHPDDYNRVQVEIEDYTSRRDINQFQVEYRFKTKDGGWRWVEERTWMHRNERGDITHFQGVIIDVTERKQVEEMLGKERKQLLSIFDSISESIYVADPDTYEVLYVNRHLREMIGGNPIGSKCYEMFQGFDKPCDFCTNERLLSTGEEAVRWEYFNEKLGKHFMILDRMMTWSDGREVRFEMAVDITPIRAAEEERNRLVTELEAKNSELEDFAYVVSHDLKAPLRAIGTLADWLSVDYSDVLDDDGLEQLNLLVQRVKRMHGLIDGVLRYSRVGRIREEWVDIDLNEMIPGIVDLLDPPEEISITVEKELPTLFLEKTRVHQVFENLISNAVKFMDKPDGRIEISVRENGRFWEFTVEDNGPGIEEKYHEKVFKIFQTLKPRDEYESTGVGLTLVKKIVSLYGGDIRVESTPGEGSRFMFTLPKSQNKLEESA